MAKAHIQCHGHRRRPLQRRVRLRRHRLRRWFDTLVKVDLQSKAVVREWYADDVYLTAPAFVPFPAAHPASGGEDAGVLVSIAYNATQDRSYAYVFDAQRLVLVDGYLLDQVVPFHGHGVTCVRQTCYPSP